MTSMAGKVVTVLLAVLLLEGAAARTCRAGEADQVWSALPPAELQKVRGGFQVGGFTFDFGAVVSTYVGGELALQTTLNWTPAGANVTQVTGATPVGAVGSESAAAILAGLGLNPALAGNGVVLKNGDGVTAVVQQLDSQHLSNLIVNTANDQSIRQDTNLTVTLPGFATTQQALMQQTRAAALASAVSQAIRLSSPR